MDFEILAKSAKIPLFCGKRAIRQMVKICYNLFTTMSFKQFRPGFQQESILLHIENVENYVENVENTVESRGNNKKLLVQRTFYSVENFAKLAATLGISRGKVHPPCGKPGSDFYRKKV